MPLPHACPAPLVAWDGGCDAPVEGARIAVGPVDTWLGPSDWEAEGRVAPRHVRVDPFAIDAFEVTVGRWVRGPCLDACKRFDAEVGARDWSRAVYGVTRDEADAFCRAEGGHLPSDDEWFAAAAGNGPRRYPWGDTGAVCRRATWGVGAGGPCATADVAADGPGSVGAHRDGATPSGVFDMAGNVAEWVGAEGGARGGSWATALATELRTWNRRELDPTARDPRVGFRCAYAKLR